MGVEQCKSCGKIFDFLARGVCRDCLDTAESEYERVRDWLRDHPGTAIPEVAEATEVSEAQIVQWMQEGRLEKHGASGLSTEEAAEQATTRERILSKMTPTEAEAEAQLAAARDFEARRRGMRSRRQQ